MIMKLLMTKMREKNMKNKKIAVTGGLGFIGSHLVENLCEDNQVIIVDNESTGKRENIQNLNLANIKLYIEDVNSANLLQIFEDCDYVFHQAALPSVPRSIKNPLKSNESNITGTLKVLIASRDCEVSKFVFASSSSVYGDTPTLPKVETMPLNPKSPYAVTKATGELYCQNFTELTTYLQSVYDTSMFLALARILTLNIQQLYLNL